MRTPRLIEMLRSPTYRALSRAAHQVLARIEIELADHGGMDNRKLPFFTSTNCFSSRNNCNSSCRQRRICDGKTSAVRAAFNGSKCNSPPSWPSEGLSTARIPHRTEDRRAHESSQRQPLGPSGRHGYPHSTSGPIQVTATAHLDDGASVVNWDVFSPLSPFSEQVVNCQNGITCNHSRIFFRG